MTDDTLISILAIQLAQYQARIHTLETILVRNNLCSIEGIAATSEEVLTKHLGEIAGRIRPEIAGYVKAMDQGGVSFDAFLQKLQDRRDEWSQGPGGSE